MQVTASSPESSGCCQLSARSQAKFLSALDFLINDLLVVFFSITDIVLDVLVCREFYIEGKFEFFAISVAIFFVAQFSYSFLFTATWGKHLSPSKKIIVFICVFPFSQLVPFFTWVEAFRFSWIDTNLKGIGLKPTSESAPENDGSGGDMLWSYIQHKYQSHAGFLAEALAEAIPQCVLQTIAVITSGRASPLFVISIIISIGVISSKGYLLSYSIHRPTFLFNFICIIADCFNLFATVSWLFSDGTDVSGGLTDTIWLWLFGIGCGLLILGGLCLVVFSMIDDNLKINRNTLPYSASQEHVWFDIYLVRSVAWVLAIIPVCVIFLTSRLSLIPIVVFKSLDPEHAQHWGFYSSLYRFLSLHLTDTRVQVTNKFVLQCRRDVEQLKQCMRRYAVTHNDNGARRSALERRPYERAALLEWLATVGSPRQARQIIITPVDSEEVDVRHQIALFQLIADTDDDTQARTAVRHAAVSRAVGGFMTDTRRELASRSEIFKSLSSSLDGEVVGDKYKFYTGMVFMCVGLFCAILWTPAFILFVIYGITFPFIRLGLDATSNVSVLSLYLTIGYILLISVLVCLIPFVWRFQLFRTDIVDMKNFPPQFYDVSVVREIHRRFNAELIRRGLETHFDILFGVDIVRYIKSFVGDYDEIFS